ncbi:exopolyphosphatase [Leuconostocaceae bacterium ESL0958]|nr:exopolyphosphatase [Leuconostocaceae bacterium ESL0958]
MADHYLAIIDLGSNSARLVIEEFVDQHYQEIYRTKTDTRLAAGMGSACQLQEAPMARTLAVLRDYVQTIASYENCRTIAIATAAVRVARNQADFLARVAETTGITLRVLSGQEEAHYDYLGVRASLPAVEQAVILDTGGASIELIAYRQRGPEAEVSLPFGAVSLTEKYGLADQIHQADIDQACQDITADYAQQAAFLKAQQGQPVILLGGANRSLARMANMADLHGASLSKEAVERFFTAISQKSRAEREQLAGLEKNRADIIISGLLPVLNLIRFIDAPRVIFSESGVREGLISELLAAYG